MVLLQTVQELSGCATTEAALHKIVEGYGTQGKNALAENQRVNNALDKAKLLCRADATDKELVTVARALLGKADV